MKNSTPVKPVIKFAKPTSIKLTLTKRRSLKKGVEEISAQLAELKLQVDTGLKEANSDLKKISTSLDSLSEMSEMESLRLQMAMDRVSKMMSMLSNVLKKMNETQEKIAGNLK